MPSPAPPRSPSATTAARRKRPPTTSEPAWARASAASPPAIGSAASQGRRLPRPLASTGQRRTRAGGTARTWRSGQRAQRRVVRRPAARPRTTGAGATRVSISNGTKAARSGASADWTTRPSAAPTRLPARPSARVWTRYVARIVRDPAPRHFRIAIVRSFRRRKALAPAATPIPPTKRPTRPTSPRYVVSWEKNRRRPGCASSKLVTRTLGSATSRARAARVARASTESGSRTRAR